MNSYHRYPYPAVAELIYGKRMRLFVITLINVTVFGASVPNILVGKFNLTFSSKHILY